MGVRRVSGAPDAGSSSSHAVGAPVNTPSRARDGGSSPTQQWDEFPESPRAALAPVRRGNGGNSRLTGCESGLRRRPSNHAARRTGRSLRIAVRDGRRRSACPPYLRGGRASPPHHDKQPWRDVGRKHPACRRPIRNGWWHTPVRGRPNRPLAGVTAARPPCGGRSRFESVAGALFSCPSG